MKFNDKEIERFSTLLEDQNTFIQDATGDMKTTAIKWLKNIDAEQKTVYVTDPFLFHSKADAVYEAHLLDILLSLKAKEIRYCAKSLNGATCFNTIQQSLDGKGCKLIHETIMSECHDRFWFCKESGKAIVFGTSLNGLCQKICRIDELNDDEVNELLVTLQAAGVTI